MTYGQVNEEQVFKCDLENLDSKKTFFYICWRGECTTKVNWDDTLVVVQKKLNALSTVSDSDLHDGPTKVGQCPCCLLL